MQNLLPTQDVDWKEAASGNFVAISAGQYHEATVFSKGGEWQIIINGEAGISRIVADESFSDADNAMERAEAVLRGAEAILVFIPPKDVTTSWEQQKATANGSSTYGRKYQGDGVSVKKAKSGKWFYIVHGSAPQGWYGSAEEAMQTFDDVYY